MPDAARQDSFATQVSSEPVSTFSVDVDTASYANARRALLQGMQPDPSTVRPEEMVNYFRYDLPRPTDPRQPFSVLTDVVRSPWHEGSLVLRIGLRAYDVARTQRLPANLVFLVDVSGSMETPDRLPLVKRALTGLLAELGPRDRVSLVTYADSARVVLKPTSDHARIMSALDSLSSGGSTAGGAGLRMAYDMARQGFIRGGINRVLIASDGDFNVGESDTASLTSLIAAQRRSGVTLTTLGVGHGTDYQDSTMETLADAGDGNAEYLDDDKEARKVLHDEITSTLQTVAKDVKAQVEFNPAAVRSYRLIGYRDRRLAERDFDDDSVDAGDIGAGHQVTALYEIEPVASGVASHRRYAANREVANEPVVPAGEEALFVKLRYKLPTGGASLLIQRPVPASALAAARLPQGDTAFALAVASFGQMLGHDPQIAGFTSNGVLALAGPQTDPQRVEFLGLVGRMAPGAPIPTTSYVPEQPPAPLPSTTTERDAGDPSSSVHWTLMLLVTLLTGGIAFVIVRAFRTRPDGLMLERSMQVAKASPPPPPKPGGLESSLRLARAESTSPETASALTVLEHLGDRARSATRLDPDGDIRNEIEAILDRHLPSYVDEYVQSRRRATAARASELEDGFRRTVEMMIARLRGLLDQQSGRDVSRMQDHERFLSERHAPSTGAD
jgi:Ca-activated chloride channel family protein